MNPIKQTCGPLLELDEVRRHLGLAGQAYLGLRTIPVSAIIETVGRCCDFDRCFHPIRPALREPTAAVRRVFSDGAVPSIDVFKVRDAYFVWDGHKRVAAARAAGSEFIDAEVTEVASRFRIDSTTDRTDLLLMERELWFLGESGLAEARPSLKLPAGTAAAYADLLRSVQAHGYGLSQAGGTLLPPSEVAAHWLECVYRPTVTAARANKLDRLLSPIADGEMFLLVEAGERILLADPGVCEELLAASAEAVAEVARDTRKPSIGWRIRHGRPWPRRKS